MKNYIGTKQVKAQLTTRKEYCDYRGWDLPKDEDPNEEIYLVEYEKDEKSKKNHPDHEGYITMSPKHVFEKAYKPSDTFVDRLIIEKDELISKITKLEDALRKDMIPEDAISDLRVQLVHMQRYRDTLIFRISKF